MGLVSHAVHYLSLLREKPRRSRRGWIARTPEVFLLLAYLTFTKSYDMIKLTRAGHAQIAREVNDAARSSAAGTRRSDSSSLGLSAVGIPAFRQGRMSKYNCLI